MMQDLDEAIKNTTDPILRINFSVMAINHLIIHHNMFDCVEFRNHKIYDIPYRVYPDQTEYFEIVTEKSRGSINNKIRIFNDKIVTKDSGGLSN